MTRSGSRSRCDAHAWSAACCSVEAEAISADERLRVERDVWSGEAVATAAIEGEVLELASVRSSVARRLGIDASLIASVPRRVEGLLDVMESAAADWDSELSAQRLCRWQAALFPAGGSALRSIETGRFRTHDDPMQIVSGPIGRETVHYVAPPSAAVPAEMDHSSRGSTARAMARSMACCAPGLRTSGSRASTRSRMAMAVSVGRWWTWRWRRTRAARPGCTAYRANCGVGSTTTTTHSMRRSAAVAMSRSGWWFTEVFTESCQARAALIEESLVRARFWQRAQTPHAQRAAAQGAQSDARGGSGSIRGWTHAAQVCRHDGSSSVTAWRDIDDLVGKGLLVKGAGAGRSTYYDLAIPGWGWVAGPGP